MQSADRHVLTKTIKRSLSYGATVQAKQHVNLLKCLDPFSLENMEILNRLKDQLKKETRKRDNTCFQGKNVSNILLLQRKCSQLQHNAVSFQPMVKI